MLRFMPSVINTSSTAEGVAVVPTDYRDEMLDTLGDQQDDEAKTVPCELDLFTLGRWAQVHLSID